MEIRDLVDECRNPLGKFHTRGTELPPSEFHVVVEIFTINADGRILLTQRNAHKTYPLFWESTGGSITAGESSAEGAVRELEEETGIAVTPKELQYLGEIQKGNYFLDSYVFRSTRDIEIGDLILQPGEVCDAKWVTLKELEDLNKRGKIVPAVWERYQLYLNELE